MSRAGSKYPSQQASMGGKINAYALDDEEEARIGG